MVCIYKFPSIYKCHDSEIEADFDRNLCRIFSVCSQIAVRILTGNLRKIISGK